MSAWVVEDQWFAEEAVSRWVSGNDVSGRVGVSFFWSPEPQAEVPLCRRSA